MTTNDFKHKYLHRSVILIMLPALLQVTSCDYNLARLSDLTILNTSVNPNVVSKGGSISVSCEILNRGDAVADFPLLQYSGLYFFLSADNAWDPGDVELDSSNIDDIDAGQSDNVSESLTIPSGTATGSYYILFIIDYESDIEEMNEDNNTGSFAIQVTD